MRRHLGAVGIIVLAVLLAYSNAPRNGFVWDDHLYVEDNPFVAKPSNLKLLLSADYYLGTNDILLASRPVFLATLLVDRALWGDRPGGYHATSVLLHAANSAAVYGLSTALGLAPGLGLWAGLLFGLHPLATEAVDAVSFRGDLLALLFSLLGLWAALAARARLPARLALSAACFGAGLLSKETAIVLPALLVLAELYFPAPKGRGKRLTAALCVFFLIACAFAGFWSSRFNYAGLGPATPLRQALDSLASAMPTAPGPRRLEVGLEKGRVLAPAPGEDRRVGAATMAKILASYFRLYLFPHPLAADRAPEPARGWGAAGVVGLIAGAAVYLRRRSPAAGFGAAWCLVALIPVSGILPLYNPAAERYFYFASAGAALAAAAGLSALPRKTLLGGILLAALAARTYVRNGDWRDEKSLFLDASRGAPQGARASFIRGGLLPPAAAEREFSAAVLIDPGFVEAWLGLGQAYAALGETAKAAECQEKAVSLQPRNPVLRFAHGIFLNRRGESARAIAEYREAVTLEPRYVEAWVNLGAALRDSGRSKEARAAYETAIALAAPGDPVPFYSFGTLLEKTGDRKGAAALYRRALERDPEYRPARERLGKIIHYNR